MSECKRSCGSDSGGARTAFTFPLGEDVLALVSAAIDDLRSWGPMVLALAGEIVSISVTAGSERWRLTRSGSQSLSSALEIVTLSFSENSADPVPYSIAVARPDERVQAALPLNVTGGGLGVALDEATPRIFVLFPILGTERLALPTVIQSTQFEPVEDRDGIWLNSDSTTSVKNREIVSAALPAIKLLIEAAAARKWAGTHRLLAFDTSAPPEWVDEIWLDQLLAKVLDDVAEVPLVATVGGEWVTILRAWLPVSDDAAQDASLWQLALGLSSSQERLPPQELVSNWSSNLKHWAQLRKQPAQEHPAAFTLSRLALTVSAGKDTASLAARLRDADEVMPWLSRLLNLVQLAKQTNLHDELALLPNQNGDLRKRRELCIDLGIPDDLKNIGAAIGVDIRGSLLDTRIDVPGLDNLLSSKSEAQAVDELTAALGKACQNGRIPLPTVAAGVELFWWLAGREQYADKLDGFAVATADGNDESCAVVDLPRRDQPDARLLAPVAVWPAAARKFAPLFPKRRVLNEAFATGQEAAAWSHLVDRGLVHAAPLYCAEGGLEDALAVNPLSDDADHRGQSSLCLSDIACLRDKDSGLIDVSRKSRTRAVQFIEFLLEYVLTTDRQAFEHLAAPCDCSRDHEVYRAAWLEPLRRKRWIPMSTDGHTADLATAGSLSALLAERPDLVRGFETDAGRALLTALGVSPADLALRVIASDEESRVSLIRSVGDLALATGGVDGVRQLVNDIQDDPGILNTITERKKNRERVRRNQGIGELVERLLRDELEAAGLRVERTGLGSDFEVECDFVEDGEEVGLTLVGAGRSTLLEVKSARGDRVKMTPRQAKVACEEDKGFALCVVPIDDDAPTPEVIRDGSRFVFGVGAHLAAAWSAYQGIEAATDAAQLTDGHVELEIVEGQVRFKVGREIWAEGMAFEDAVGEFIRRSDPARSG